MAKKKITFEQAIQRLEEIVQLLETEEIPLEKSVDLYKEGMELSEICQTKITKAETEVVLLQKNISGEIEQTHFEVVEGE